MEEQIDGARRAMIDGIEAFGLEDTHQAATQMANSSP